MYAGIKPHEVHAAKCFSGGDDRLEHLGAAPATNAFGVEGIGQHAAAQGWVGFGTGMRQAQLGKGDLGEGARW